MKAIAYALSIVILCEYCRPDSAGSDRTLQPKTSSHIWESSCDESKGEGLSITTIYIPSEKTNVKFGLYPVSQRIALFNSVGEVKLKSLPFKSHIDSVSTADIQVLDCIVTNVKCVQAGDKLLYYVYGGGTIDPPREFFGLLSMEIGWLWWYYGNHYEVYSEYGDIDSLNNIYGEEIIGDLNGMTSTLPY